MEAEKGNLFYFDSICKVYRVMQYYQKVFLGGFFYVPTT